MQSEEEGITDLTGRTGYCNTNWFLTHGARSMPVGCTVCKR